MVNSVGEVVCFLCVVFGYASLVRQRHALKEKKVLDHISSKYICLTYINGRRGRTSFSGKGWLL